MLGSPFSSVDWEATGSMLQGWGALGAVGAVIYAAANAFGAYRRQKLEDRRIDAAERVLTFAYRLEDDLSAIRNPAMSGPEIRKAADALAQKGLTSGVLGKDAFADACKAQALLDRLIEREKGWSDFANIRVLARAHFEDEVETELNRMWSQRDNIISSATPYVDPASADMDNSVQLGSVFEINFVGALRPVYIARVRLENLLLPIIRSDFVGKPLI